MVMETSNEVNISVSILRSDTSKSYLCSKEKLCSTALEEMQVLLF